MQLRELLEMLSAICLALPEATREDANGHAIFSVRSKRFTYFLNDHHGDGIVSVCVKATPEDGVALSLRTKNASIVPPTSDRGAGSVSAST